MGLNFFKWIREKTGGNTSKISAQEIECAEFFDLSTNIYIRELAFWSCINLVVKAICNCEFKTLIGGEEKKGREYYLWNLEPNLNQNKTEFICQLISRLFRDNEALVVEINGQRLVADSYSMTPYAVKEDVFKDVQVKGFTFNRSFVQSEVLHFKLSDKNMRLITDGINDAYQKMIDYAMKSYQKSRGQKAIITVDAMGMQQSNYKSEYERLLNGDFSKFFNAESAVFPLWKGFKFDDLGSKTYSNEGTRDIRSMIDDVCSFTAKGIGIPPALVSGEVAGTGEAVDQLLTFCIDPLARILEQENNRKVYKYQGFSRGDCLKIDTSMVKHIDLFDISTPIDKLISSGTFSVNGILRLLGRPEVKEDWAEKHVMTLNYAATDQAKNSTGGEENEE